MNGLNALGKGFVASLRAISVAGWLYVVNFLLALLVTSAFRTMLVNGFGSSMALDGMLRGFDYTTYADFMNLHGDGVKSLFAQFTWGTVFVLFLNAIVGGGIVTAIRADKRISMKEFLAASGEFAGRMLRLFLVSAFVVVAMFFILSLIIGIIYATVDATADSEKTVVINVLGGLALLAIPFFLTLMVADYARVYLVQENERSALRAYWQGMRIVFRNFFSAWTVQVAMLVVILAAIALYWLFESRFTASTERKLVVLFTIQQLFILSRLWMRLWSLGSIAAIVALPRESVEEQADERSDLPSELAPSVPSEVPSVSASVIRKSRAKRKPAASPKAPPSRAKKRTSTRRK